MRSIRQSFLLCSMIVAFLALMTGCVTSSGPVVKRTEVAPDQYSESLNSEGMTSVYSMQSPSGTKVPEELQALMEGAVEYSLVEYLARYPQAQETLLDYRLGPGDVFGVTVRGDDTFSGQDFSVSPSGYSFLPLIDQVEVGGRTVVEIASRIQSALISGQYFTDPDVKVYVKKFLSKRALVLGAIGNPGYSVIRPGMGIMDLLFEVGGKAVTAGNRSTIVRMQPETGEKVAIDVKLDKLVRQGAAREQLLIRDRDTLYVHPAIAASAYIMGEVKTPGEVELGDADVTLIQAIGQAGGFTRIAASNRVKVIRRGQDKDTVFEVDVQRIIDQGLKSEDLPLKGGDVVVVPESYF